MGSVAAHSSKVLVSAWDGIERKGVGVGFSVFCKFCLGTMSMLHLELMFSSDVFKSKHTEEFGVQVGMTRLTDCRLSFRQSLGSPQSMQGFEEPLHSSIQ